MLQILAGSDTFCHDTLQVWELIGSIVKIVQIAIPVIIILLGTIDLGKAVMAGKDDEIKGAQKMFIRRLIYGLAVFFVVFIVRAVFNVIAESSDATSGSGKECFCAVAGSKNC